jgi:hypothetical protein
MPSHAPRSIPFVTDFEAFLSDVVVKLFQFLQLVRSVGLFGPSLEKQSSDMLLLADAKIVFLGWRVRSVRYKQECLMGDGGMIAESVVLIIHF